MGNRTIQATRSTRFGKSLPPSIHIVDSKKEKKTLIRSAFLFIIATTTFVSLSQYSKNLNGKRDLEVSKSDEVHAVGIPGMGMHPSVIDVPKAIKSIRAENDDKKSEATALVTSGEGTDKVLPGTSNAGIKDSGASIDPFQPETPRETHMPALVVQKVESKPKAAFKKNGVATKNKQMAAIADQKDQSHSEQLNLIGNSGSLNVKVETPLTVPTKVYNEADTLLHIHQGLVDRFDFLAALDSGEKLDRAVASLKELDNQPIDTSKHEPVRKIAGQVTPTKSVLSKPSKSRAINQNQIHQPVARNRFDNASSPPADVIDGQVSFEERFAELWNESEYPAAKINTPEYSFKKPEKFAQESTNHAVAVANLDSSNGASASNAIDDAKITRTNKGEPAGSVIRITTAKNNLASTDAPGQDAGALNSRKQGDNRFDALEPARATNPDGRKQSRQSAPRNARSATSTEDAYLNSHEYSKLDPIKYVVAFDVSSQVQGVEVGLGADLGRQDQIADGAKMGQWKQAFAKGYMPTLHYQSVSNEYRTYVEMLSENTLQLPLIPTLEEGKAIVELRVPGDAKVRLLGSSAKAIYFTDDKRVFKDEDWLLTRESKRVIFANVDAGTATSVIEIISDHGAPNVMGSVTFPTSANVSTYLDLSKYGRFRVSGTVFDASTMTLKSEPAVQVGFLHDLGARKISDAKGAFEFDRIPVFADYPIVLETTSREGLRFRYQMEAVQIRSGPISLFTFSNEYVQSLINQLEGGISWDKSLVIGAIPVHSSLFEKNEKGEGFNPEDLFPEIDSFEEVLKAKSASTSDASGGEGYSLSPQGYLLTESALRTESPRFAFFEASRGPNIAKLVSKDRKTAWSNLLYNEKQTISVVIGN